MKRMSIVAGCLAFLAIAANAIAADPLQSSGGSNYIAKTGDCIGNDIEVVTLPLAACESRCDENAFCLGVSFRANDNRCVLKRATCSNPVPAEHQFYQQR